MKLLDLLPPHEDGTKDLLPNQRVLVESTAKYIADVGGVGSGKTIIICAMCVVLSVQVPGNRGIVVRRSYSKLHDATEQVFLEVLGRANIPDVKYRDHRDGFPHRIILPNASEIFFRESKDLGRFLGPEYGWFFIDEAQEEPWETMKGLMERLRLPRAKKYLKGFVATNPPHVKHWIAKLFGSKPGVKEVKEPTTGVVTKYQLIRSSTRDNTNLPPGYLADLLSNNPDTEIARMVDGFFGFSQDGQPVYPQFKLPQHVGVGVLKEGLPLIRGWDFGFHHPACTWHQLWRCVHKQPHWGIFHEFDMENVESEEFAKNVLEETARVFPRVGLGLLMDAGDKAGAQISEKGPGPIIRLARPKEMGGFSLSIRYRGCPIEPGLDLIRKLLSRPCPCGLPGLMVDRDCVNVIAGFAGGYHYPRRQTQSAKEVPFKDKFYDDFMDSIRYFAENYVRLFLIGDDFLGDVMKDDFTRNPMDEPVEGRYEWMNTPASLIA